jgi:hypothetical protein
MFGLGKKEIPLGRVAEAFANAALCFLKDPTEQDLMLQSQAAAVGMERTHFLLEASALQYFTVIASINTRRLTGGMREEQASRLMEAMFHSHYRKFHEGLPLGITIDFGLLGLDIEDAFNFISRRSDEYIEPKNFLTVPSNIQVPRLFAQFCGVLDPNDVLQRIGWSIFVIRGAMYLDTLKGLKIV